MSHTVEILSVGTELLLGNIANTCLLYTSRCVKETGLSSPQSTLRAECPGGHFLLRSLAASLQMGPAVLGSHLGENSAADQSAVLVGAKSALFGTACRLSLTALPCSSSPTRTRFAGLRVGLRFSAPTRTALRLLLVCRVDDLHKDVYKRQPLDWAARPFWPDIFWIMPAWGAMAEASISLRWRWA